MKQDFKSISISYKNAPLKTRELVALNEEQSLRLLHKINDVLKVEDLLILSTCNRTEIYFSSLDVQPESIIKLLAAEKGIKYTKKLASHFVEINGKEAARHLFKVAVGLESQVVGDLQIINQVKRAYQVSADANVVGPVLHRLMHAIFFTNKRVVQETTFKDGAASVSYATVDLIEDLTHNIIDPQILAIGVGEIGTDVVRNLKEFGFKNVTVINRTRDKAEELAMECGFVAEDFYQLNKLVKSSEVIISSISTDQHLISYDFVSRIKIPGYKHFFDLSIPRTIEQKVEKVPGVSLHNIDHIKAKTDQALEKRLQAIGQVEEIIDESLVEFYKWSKEVSVSPTLKKFKNALEDIRQEELAKYVKKLDPKEAKMVDSITKSIMQKIVKLPALSLKAACKRDDAEILADVLNELFNLEKEPEKKER